MIFGIKVGEHLRWKNSMVAGVHTAENPSTLTYSSVISRDMNNTA